MDTRKAYQEKIEAQLKEWSAMAKQWQAKAEMAKADAKIDMLKQLQTLQAKQEVAQQKLQALKDVGDAAWEKAKPDPQAMEHLQSAWEKESKNILPKLSEIRHHGF